MDMVIGNIVRRLRKEKKMTLSALSERSGVALATLSRMEHGKMTGTLRSHMRICEALEITLPEFYRELSPAREAVQVRTREDRPDVFLRDKRHSVEVLASRVLNKKMMPVLIRLEKGASTQEEKTRPGVERFVYVVEGKVEACIGKERYALAKADTLYFESSLPHSFKNTGPSESRLICVTCPPIL
jgi:transcriptional regulator with XRE-family HTH domain